MLYSLYHSGAPWDLFFTLIFECIFMMIMMYILCSRNIELNLGALHRNPQAFCYPKIAKIAILLRKCENTLFSKFKIYNLYQRYEPIFCFIVFPPAWILHKKLFWNFMVPFSVCQKTNAHISAFFGYFRPLDVKFSR